MTESIESTDDTDSYKGYQLFSDVENKLLRDWNRAVTLHNMCSDGNKDLLKGYISHLDKNSITGCFVLTTSLRKKGYDAVKKSIDASLAAKEAKNA